MPAECQEWQWNTWSLRENIVLKATDNNQACGVCQNRSCWITCTNWRRYHTASVMLQKQIALPWLTFQRYRNVMANIQEDTALQLPACKKFLQFIRALWASFIFIASSTYCSLWKGASQVDDRECLLWPVGLDDLEHVSVINHPIQSTTTHYTNAWHASYHQHTEVYTQESHHKLIANASSGLLIWESPSTSAFSITQSTSASVTTAPDIKGVDVSTCCARGFTPRKPFRSPYFWQQIRKLVVSIMDTSEGLSSTRSVRPF